jgi:archaellum component FlaG (FlaF/FlaG flagellin family)
MNDRIENQYSMMLKVKTFYNAYKATVDTYAALIPMFVYLLSQIDKIADLFGTATEDTTGAAVDKGLKRDELILKILKLSNAYSGLKYSENNNTEAERYDETQSSLGGRRDSDLYLFAKKVLAVVGPVIGDLADYNVVAADVTDMEAALDEYFDHVQEPRFKIGDKAAYRKFGTVEVKTTMDFLNNKMDKSMKAMSIDHPIIYQSYLNSRKIDDTGAHSTPDYEGIVTPGSIMMIANLPFDSERTFLVKNKGEQSFTFCLSTTETMMEGDIIPVEPGQEVQRKSSNLNNVPTANFLLIENTAPVNAEYEVRVQL